VNTLIAAAEKLEASLAGYARATHDLLKVTLDSKKNVERAADALARVAALDEELASSVSGLVGIISAMRDRQQAEAESVQQKAVEIVQRKQVLDGLLEQLRGLAGEVRQVGEMLDAVRKKDEGATLGQVLDRISQLIDQAHGFANEAQAKDFADLSADGHALRQQLLSVKNKAGLLKGKMPEA
jgi:hypothetical protein